MKRSVLLILLFATFAATVAATPLGYGNIGEPITLGRNLTASGGEVVAYFFGSQQSTGGRLWLNSLGPALANKTTVGNAEAHPGDSFSFGTFAAGTTLTFRLEIDDKKKWGNKAEFLGGEFYDAGNDNPGGIAYAFVTAWDGTKVHGNTLQGPAVYIGFEDLKGGKDFDYDDFQYVVAGVLLSQDTGAAGDPAGVPEAGTLLLAGAGLVMLRLATSKAPRKN